jgi:hypothetical protein
VSAIGFTVDLRQRPAASTTVSAFAGASAIEEPTLELRVTAKPKIFAERPSREEIIATMADLGYRLARKLEGVQEVAYGTDGNIARISTTKPPEESPEELYVTGRIWSRWGQATKDASFSFVQTITWRQFFGACLYAIKRQPGCIDEVAEACADLEKMRQFAGATLWRKWCQDNDPRSALLQALVREELDGFQRARL